MQNGTSVTLCLSCIGLYNACRGCVYHYWNWTGDAAAPNGVLDDIFWEFEYSCTYSQSRSSVQGITSTLGLSTPKSGCHQSDHYSHRYPYLLAHVQDRSSDHHWK